jgi:hypothetical protein
MSSKSLTPSRKRDRWSAPDGQAAVVSRAGFIRLSHTFGCAKRKGIPLAKPSIRKRRAGGTPSPSEEPHGPHIARYSCKDNTLARATLRIMRIIPRKTDSHGLTPDHHSVKRSENKSSAVSNSLPLSALIPPAILRLGLFEVERVPARLIACLSVSQHTGHILGVDRQHEATMGSRL